VLDQEKHLMCVFSLAQAFYAWETEQEIVFPLSFLPLRGQKGKREKTTGALCPRRKTPGLEKTTAIATKTVIELPSSS
jgi:hypothetical protein